MINIVFAGLETRTNKVFSPTEEFPRSRPHVFQGSQSSTCHRSLIPYVRPDKEVNYREG